MAENPASENPESPKTQSTPAPKSVDLNVGGNIGGNVVVGDHNYIVNNYYPKIESNTDKHEPDYWALKHPYPMPPNFAGRIAERALLTHWLKEDSENRLFILRALGGFGKSALSWQWLTHDVDIKEYPKVVFWSFYEGDASFEHFIEETLKYLKLDVPQGQRPQVDELLKAMQSQKVLLIMDGFERALRAYSSMNAAYQGDIELPSPLGEGAGGGVESATDCVNINAEIFLKSICSLPNIKSKVLITTRLTPRAIKPRGELMLGCREQELTAMQKADAVEFFRKQKIRGTHAEIEAACAPYGYHPLSLRLLAGCVLKDLHKPGDISVAQNIKIDGDLKQHQHHVLQVSYDSLSIQEQKLLSQIACFRSPISFDTLEAISKPVPKEKPKGLRGIFSKKVETESFYTGNIESDLQDLIERGILQHDSKDKYDLLPIVRRYAYERLTATDRTGAHERLVNYFEAVPQPEKIEILEDLTHVIELYHHMVRAGKLDEARVLFRDRLTNDLYYQLGAYQLIAELLSALSHEGEDKPPRLKDKSAQGWLSNFLGSNLQLSGQSRRAVQAFETSVRITEELNDKKNLSTALGNLAILQFPIGNLHAAESNLQRRINLCKEIQNEFSESVGHQQLGYSLAYRGTWDEAEQELARSTKYWEETKDVQGICLDDSFRALRALLMHREPAQSEINNPKSAIEFAQRALKSAEDSAKTRFPMERDFVRAHWLLGAAYRLDGQLNLAEQHLSEALTRDRAINMVDHEANILLDLARLSFDYGLASSAQDKLKHFEQAKSLAEEALPITERCGYVLQGADVNLFLAQYALEQEKDKAKAKEYAETALAEWLRMWAKIGICKNVPNVTVASGRIKLGRQFQEVKGIVACFVGANIRLRKSSTATMPKFANKRFGCMWMV